MLGQALVQQPCSNPSKSPETLRTAPYSKYGDLQAFCKLQKPPAVGSAKPRTCQSRETPRGAEYGSKNS
jgi:hypothetical protein